MPTSDKLVNAFRRFDEANGHDPNTEQFMGKTYPKELLYAMRMTERLNEYSPDASEALRLAAHCQHIQRWEIPRKSYEINRAGYLKWRQELKKFHAKKASKILKEVGYSKEITDQVCILLKKQQLKKNADTQVLEDVICLVFLEFYFEPFAQKHPEEKTIDILKKTWRKMSEKGQTSAALLPLSKQSLDLITKAVAG